MMPSTLLRLRVWGLFNFWRRRQSRLTTHWKVFLNVSCLILFLASFTDWRKKVSISTLLYAQVTPNSSFLMQYSPFCCCRWPLNTQQVEKKIFDLCASLFSLSSVAVSFCVWCFNKTMRKMSRMSENQTFLLSVLRFFCCMFFFKLSFSVCPESILKISKRWKAKFLQKKRVFRLSWFLVIKHH